MEVIKAKKLSDEESGQINGGIFFWTSSDSDFLKHIGVMNESFSTTDLILHWERFSQGRCRLGKAWDNLRYKSGRIR